MKERMNEEKNTSGLFMFVKVRECWIFFFFKGHTRNVSCDTLELLHLCCEEQFVTQCADFGNVASGNLQNSVPTLTEYLLHFWQIETINPQTFHRRGAFNVFDNNVIYDTSICLPLHFFFLPVFSIYWA